MEPNTGAYDWADDPDLPADEILRRFRRLPLVEDEDDEVFRALLGDGTTGSTEFRAVVSGRRGSTTEAGTSETRDHPTFALDSVERVS
jgi:hypothetical protein